MVMLSKTIILSYVLLHSHCDMGEFPNLNHNLMTQFNEGESYQGIRTIKTFESENTRNNIKCCNH